MKFINPKVIAFQKHTCYSPVWRRLESTIIKDLKPQPDICRTCNQFSFIMWINLPKRLDSFGVGFSIN